MMQEYFCRDLKGLAYEDGSARTTANDGMAGVVGLELRNVGANYPFEKSHRYPGTQPNSGHRDYSRLSCGVGRHSSGLVPALEPTGQRPDIPFPADRRCRSNWHLYDWPMNNVQQAIRDAAEKGGYRYRWWKVNDLEHGEGYNGLQLRALSEHLHDPSFWKALATARKWEDSNAWRFHWHRFIDHLADGKDAESFFAAL
jgi:hypothetical protein